MMFRQRSGSEGCRLPWFSWWAYTILRFPVFTLGGTVLYYYNHQKKLKLELYMDSLEMKKKEENHQAQLRFFTNISHDFRTPLSLIMASVEHMQQQYGNNHYIRLLNSNARRLLNLVNELMDFRTVENGKMKLKVHLSNINRFVQEVASDFQGMLCKRRSTQRFSAIRLYLRLFTSMNRSWRK